jgi:hypothetical protein
MVATPQNKGMKLTKLAQAIVLRRSPVPLERRAHGYGTALRSSRHQRVEPHRTPHNKRMQLAGAARAVARS